MSLLGMVSVLALGLGANGAIADAIDQLLLRPPAGVRDPEQLVRLSTFEVHPEIGTLRSETISYPLATMLLSDTSVLVSGAPFMVRTVSVQDGNTMRQLRVAFVAGDYFSALGVRPMLGQGLLQDPAGATLPGLVLSYSLWRTRYGGAVSVLGRTLRVSGLPYPVVGVAPAGFSGIDLSRIDLWAPLDGEALQSVGADWRTNQAAAFLAVVARLHDGVSPRAAEQRLSGLFRNYLETTGRPVTDAGVVVQRQLRVSGADRRDLVDAARLLAGISLLLLLTASANAASLLVSRLAGRDRDVATEMALGAPTARIVGALLADAVVIGALSALAGTIFTALIGRAIQWRVMPELGWSARRFSLTLLLAAYAVASVALGALTILPWLRTHRAAIVAGLASAPTATRRHTPGRSIAVAAQAAVAVTLVAGATLFIGTFRRLVGRQLGFDAERVLVVDFDSAARLLGGSLTQRLREVQEALLRVPEVADAALSSAVPFRRSAAVEANVSGRGPISGLPTGGPYLVAVDEHFTPTVGATILEGRAFDRADVRGLDRVAIVNQTLARHVWRGESPLGACVRLLDEPECRRVIGVVRDLARSRALEPPTLQIFVPYTQAEPLLVPSALLIRARGDAAGARAAVTRTIIAQGYDLSRVTIEPLADLLRPELMAWRFATVVFAAYGVVALLVVGLGVFSILSVTIAQRRRELAIRAALGAGTGDILLAAASGLWRAVGAGALLGTAAVFVLWKSAMPLLIGVTAQLVTLSAALAALAVALVLVACVLALSPHRAALGWLHRDLRRA
jgi:predicted permease